MKKLTLALVFAAALFTSATAFAQNGATQVREEFCSVTYNDCCGEWIEYCLDVHYTFAKDGSMQHVNASGKGTGSNGTNYVIGVVQNVNQNIHDNGGGNYTITLTQKINAVGGSDCGSTWKIVIHVTVNANGETTSVVESVEIHCENDLY